MGRDNRGDAMRVVRGDNFEQCVMVARWNQNCAGAFREGGVGLPKLGTLREVCTTYASVL